MAGTIVANTINTDTGVFTSNNAYSGIAKAWCQYNGSTSTVVGSFNVSSVTLVGTGIYQFNFATAMPSAGYVATGSYNSNNSSTGGYAQSFYNYLTTSVTGTPYPTPGSAPTITTMAVFSS